MSTEDRGLETGDGSQETEDRKQETGDRRRETGDRRGFSDVISEKFSAFHFADLATVKG